MAEQSDIRKLVHKEASALERLATRIFENPELGMEEEKACAWQLQLLKRWGFNIQNPFCGLPTAYKATVGRGGPTFCIMSEYDALPEIGHACGHNLICAATMGAGRAVSTAMKRESIKGCFVVMGTPAEEAKGGKVALVRKDAMKGIDAAMMVHPSFRTIGDHGCSAVTRYEVTFKGKAAHSAAAPEKGKNALDAVMLFFHAVNAWRQQLPEESRVHGIVTNGGDAPNIIPDLAACHFYLRSPSDRLLAGMCKRFERMARGAAMMTDTRMTLDADDHPYKARKPNSALTEAYLDAAEVAGLKPVRKGSPGRASTDFGDVSQVVPGSHVYFGIAQRAIACHSVDFREAAGSAYGREQMLRAAEAMGWVAYRYMTDEDFRSSVQREFPKS